MHSLILCSLNRISCGAVVNWYKQRLSNVHTILKKNALCVHTYSLAYTLTHVRMISPQEKKTKKKQHTQTWIISRRTKRSDLCKDSSFSPQSSSVSSQFHILSGCVKKIQQREIRGEIQGLLSIWLSVESEIAIWTMRFPGKHLLYRENNTALLFWAFECAPVQ